MPDRAEHLRQAGRFEAFALDVESPSATFCRRIREQLQGWIDACGDAQG